MTSCRRPRHGRRPRLGRGDRGADRGLRPRPEADAARAPRAARPRPAPALAGRQHPPAGHGGQGQPRALRPAALPGGRRRRRRARSGSGAGSSSGRPGSTTWSAPSTRAKYGRVSDRLVLEATIPTLVDPSLAAREGGHVVSVVAQYVPYRLRDGAWDDAARTALGERVVAALEEVAPGIGVARHGARGPHAGRPRGRVRPDRRPPLPPGARASTPGSPGGRSSAGPATGCRSRGSTSSARAPTPAAASPARRRTTR